MEDKNTSIRLTPNEMDILHVLVEHAENLYGLEIIKRINKLRTDKEFNFNKIGYGSFYTALKKLEREKLVTSSTPENDKRKKYYLINGNGKHAFYENNNYNTKVLNL